MAYTGISMPYGSMASVITTDPIERTKLSRARSFGGIGVGILFAVVLERSDKMDADRFVRRVKDACPAFNRCNEKPYYIEISMGYQDFYYGDAQELTPVFKQADMHLYEAKKQRRRSVIRICE